MNDCERPHYAHGWCQLHYGRWRANGDPLVVRVIVGNDELRVRSYIPFRGPDECWPWLGVVEPAGYGRIGIAGRSEMAHRVVYRLLVGPIPDELSLDHDCHNRALDCAGGHLCRHRRCVNPAHLIPRTHRDNMLSSTVAFGTINAAKTQCPQGHPYDEANTYVLPSRPHARYCKECNNARGRERRRST